MQLLDGQFDEIGLLGPFEAIRFQSFGDMADPLGNHDAIFGQQTTKLIGLRRSCLDETLACPVQGEDRLLLTIFDGDKSHVRSPYSFTNGFSIGRIVLVRLDVRFYKLRGHQLYCMSQCSQFSGPKMGAAAGFHANHATHWKLAKYGSN